MKASKEYVSEYPLPKGIKPVNATLKVMYGDITIANTTHAFRILQKGLPPSYYFPTEDVRMDYLHPSTHTTTCNCKGIASYYDIQVGDTVLRNAAWTYLDAEPDMAHLNGHIAFYPHTLECYVNGERVTGQEDTHYGGWITKNIIGPFGEVN